MFSWPHRLYSSVRHLFLAFYDIHVRTVNYTINKITMERGNMYKSIYISKPKRCEWPTMDVLSTSRKRNTSGNSKKETFRKSKKCSELNLKLFQDQEPMYLKNVHIEELVLPLKMYLKLPGNYMNKIKKHDLRYRLVVEPPNNEVNAVTDYDMNFYSCIDGRPVKDRYSCLSSVKKTSTFTRINHDIGIKNDAVLNIDTAYLKELKMYNKALVICWEQQKFFDCFISEDYHKSMNSLFECKQLNNKLQRKITVLCNLANEEFTITSRLLTLDYLYKIQQKYGRFLYYVSPPAWRSKNRDFAQSVEIEAKGFDLGKSSEDDAFDTVFEKMQNECSRKLVKPMLYFTQPHDLIDIFERIQIQQLHHFSYVTHMAPLITKIKEGIKYLNDILSQESAFVTNKIENLQKYLELTEEKCTQLKSRFFTILNGMFYENVASDDNLKLRIHLEFCYEKVFVEKPVNMDIKSIAKCLEDFYMKHFEKIDELCSDTVYRSLTKRIQTEQQLLRKANNAARERRLFDKLDRQLRQAYQPAVTNRLKSLSPPTQSKRVSNFVKKGYSCLQAKLKQENLLSDSEVEFLTLFTDWTEGEDPFKYMHEKKNSGLMLESSTADDRTDGGFPSKLS